MQDTFSGEQTQLVSQLRAGARAHGDVRAALREAMDSLHDFQANWEQIFADSLRAVGQASGQRLIDRLVSEGMLPDGTQYDPARTGSLLEQALLAGQATDAARAIVETTREALSDQLSTVIDAGAVNDVINQLQQQYDTWINGGRSSMIADTAVVGQWSLGEMDAAFQAANVTGASASRTWVTMGDDRVRTSHADADGDEAGLGEPFTIGDEDLMYPGDPSGSLEEIAGCRCYLEWNFDLASGGGAGDLSNLSEDDLAELEDAGIDVSDLGAGAAGEALDASEVTAASDVAEAAAEPLDWEQQHVADMARAYGVDPPQELFGRGAAATSSDWEQWYREQIVPLLPEGYVDPVFGAVTNSAEDAASDASAVAPAQGAEAIGGDALRSEAAQMRALINPDFAETGSLDDQVQQMVNYEQSKAAMLADNPDWQAFVESLGRRTFEFGGGTFTPEMQAVQVMEGSWTTLVIDSGSVNVALRQVAQDMFGLELPERTIASDVQAAADEFIAAHGGAIRAYLQATYEQTQQWFADQGITELTLYRGASRAEALEGLLYDGSAVERAIAGAAFSSYSADPALALGFSTSVSYVSGDYRSLTAMRVPVDQVFGTPFTSMAKQSESEFLVFGSKQGACLLSWLIRDEMSLDTALDTIGGVIPAD